MTHIINSTPAQEYLADLRNRAAKKTASEATYILREFEAFTTGREVTPTLLSDWRNHIAQQDVMDSTRNLWIRHVKMFLNWRADTGRMPAINLRCLKAFREDKRAPVVLSREEITRLVAACEGASDDDKRVARTVLVMLFTGCRRHEALKIHKADMLQDGLRLRSDKTRSERIFPWVLLGDARRFLDVCSFEWNRHGWARIRKAAGLVSLRPKGLRSTAATYLFSAPALNTLYTPRTLAAIMGHSLQVCEKHYLGQPVFNIHGTSMPEFYGLAKLCA